MEADFWHWSRDGSQQSMDSEAFHSPLCHQMQVEEVPIFHVTTSADRVPFRELGRSYGMSQQKRGMNQ